ncbi:3-hydroxyacyl-CoA dehydrogenase NAD-binding domain-containing protein [Allonocardiopsis opalescens]|uniref:3-hydroxybutyryl-CoA dehydrogenase/5-formyl-3-hydroxy-2-methylpyridine 4-carboxylate dehydrogenase n=1 Tax=Allonocardiopsis opalescens TaxID=1144618 RepID=A0A2T0PZ07_9ACTN|nr:3-hydroxyacyl-CoA dehydrogenase NAD-binding domain-containing protein [Allonocardiopsis opalescens]PRX96758.1 3-hydroxybutyryl-CoA dehydrogenase/5-formyl-3-hydroxy-2-methylpyridine 4-carboxylate dehydrogenase [Allonocardiopsis opalescens]
MSVPTTTAVIGSGTMGPGIAALMARYGSTVRLNDVSAEVLERAAGALAIAESVLDRLGVPTTPGGSVSCEADLAAALDGADLVIEAVPERLDLKRAVLAEIEAAVRDDAVIGTNTSGIPVSELAADMAHPERLIGMHWSNPPHVIPMIEVIPGERTAEGVRDALVETVRAIGYEAVVEKEVPGFVENRILYAILRECLSLVEQGVVSRQDLDTCVKWGIGYKLAVIGPMRLLDMAGLDIYESVAGYLNRELSTEAGVSPLVTEMTGQRKLGMKTGGGMYAYGEGDVAAKRADIIAGLITVRRALSDTTPV